MPHHPVKKKNLEIMVFVIVILATFVFRFQHIKSIPAELTPREAFIASEASNVSAGGNIKIYYETGRHEGLFVNIQALASGIFGNHSWGFRIFPAILGFLSIIGLYLLTRLLFGWRIASLSSFLMTISFWHTFFSRIGLSVVLASCLMIWAIYFLWRGKQTGSFAYYGIGGILWGLGFYSHWTFVPMTFVLILVLTAYVYAVKKDFSGPQYRDTKNQIARGLALFMILFIFIILPLFVAYISGNSSMPRYFIDTTDTSTLGKFTKNLWTAIGQFNGFGSANGNYGTLDYPLLLWPISILFIVGLLRGLHKLVKIKKTHGHFSTTQVLLFSWLAVGLISASISGNTFLGAVLLISAPAVFIFAGEGLWWIYNFITRWHYIRDKHEVSMHGYHWTEGRFVAVLTILIFLSSLTFVSYSKYFKEWAKNPELQKARNESHILYR